MAWKIFKKIKQANEWVNDKVKPLVVELVGQEKADMIDKPKDIGDVLSGSWEAFKKGSVIGASISGFRVPQLGSNPPGGYSPPSEIKDLVGVSIEQVKKYWVLLVVAAFAYLFLND